MSKNAPNRTHEHWVFGDYLVFANNCYAAKRIYESIADRRDGRVMFGSITLDDMTNGYWIMIKHPFATPQIRVAPNRPDPLPTNSTETQKEPNQVSQAKDTTETKE